MTTTPAPGADLSRLRLGTAPDSWGVWFPDDPHQVPWHQFLDEVVQGGYQWIELGPYGYLPTDPEQLRDELGRRGLQLSGGAVFAGLHRGAEAYEQALKDCREEAALLGALGASHLVLLPEQYTRHAQRRRARAGRARAGAVERPGHRHVRARQGPAGGVRHLAGLPPARRQPRRHPAPGRAASCRTPTRSSVSLCLDTGHISYCDGDNLEIIRAIPDPHRLRPPQAGGPCHRAPGARGAALVRGRRQARRDGANRPAGIPAMEPLLAELGTLDVDLFAIVEQDLYPCEPDYPLPVATRTRKYLNGCGLGPAPRRR